MVLVFKTSVQHKKQVKQLKPLLDHSLKPAVWNFDLEDCDKIFRVEASSNISHDVIRLLNKEGFSCEELI
ncbi:MAG: hypothetical protein JST26_16195 [Bacteroidetes bacterium]|nr:hypothetical protein [Bacteroidota bacterium]